MKIDLTKLQILKEKIRTTKDFDEPVHYFFDHFADHKEFINMSIETEDELLDQIILGIGQEVFKKKNITIQQKLFLTVEGYDFIHGPVIIENRMMSFVYFTDIRLGVFSVHLPTQMMYGRMNALSLKNFKMPPDVTLN
jgi:hypothetical protein